MMRVFLSGVFLLLLVLSGPQARAQADVSNMLLLDVQVQLEATDAVNAMYNFKYAEAEAKYRELKKRYPYHPLPYFLLGLSEWWKIVPTNITTEKYDNAFHAYMDSAIYFAEKIYDKEPDNYEAAFFLSAAWGFKGRLYSERKNWRKATFAGKHSLEYLEASKAGNALSPEFLFGDALFNYYAVWIGENYPLLKPVLLFFPDGDKKKGVEQLRTVARNAFYTRTEAQFFLMKILAGDENNSAEALPVSRYLAQTFPDNAYFQRYYARMLFVDGQLTELEKVSASIMDKLEAGMPGYEGISGRYAAYYLAYINQHRYKNLDEAKKYYRLAIMYAKQTDALDSGYSLNAHASLARLADKEGDKQTARQYYEQVKKLSERKSELHKEAQKYLKNKR